MRRSRAVQVVVIALAATLASAGPASAELFFDLYGGASFPGKPDFDITTEGVSRETERGDPDTTATGGGRVGWWFSEIGLPWLGVAGDVSYFEPEFTSETGRDFKVKVRTVPMSPLVLLRLGVLQAPEYPVGQIQFYAGAGPGFFWTEETARFPGGEEVSADTIEVGVDARAGIAWHFTPNWKVFTEYRFTYYSIAPDGRIGGQRTEVEADLDTHHWLFGVGYTFR